MGAQWKHAGRQANALKRGAVIGKLVKEIIVSVKMGDPSPDNNFRLRAAIEAAKKASVPRDTIDRCIKKASGQGDDQIFETITYEGFAPHQVPVIVECLTDNRNRTASDIRVLFRKGHLGSVGSVGWMFDRLGVIEATHPEAGLDLEGSAIEAGAQNVESLDASDIPSGHSGARFFCETTDLDSVNKSLTAQGWIITLSEMNYVVKNKTELSEADATEVSNFLSDIDDHDDVHRIYTSL